MGPQSSFTGQMGSRWFGELVLLTWGPYGSWSSWRSSLPPPTSAQSAPKPDGMPVPKTELTVWHLAAPKRLQWRGRTESSLDLRPREGGQKGLREEEKHGYCTAQMWLYYFILSYTEEKIVLHMYLEVRSQFLWHITKKCLFAKKDESNRPWVHKNYSGREIKMEHA